MKKELMLSTLMLATTVSSNSFASAEAAINKASVSNEKTIQTPVFVLRNPFNNETTDVYAVITIVKEGFKLEDLNFGKITHQITFKFFNKDGSEYKGFELAESDEGGWYMELRGAGANQKSYVLWSCSSTFNCGQEAPGFLHMFVDEREAKNPYYYTINLPVMRFADDGQRQLERLYFYVSTDFIITK